MPGYQDPSGMLRVEFGYCSANFLEADSANSIHHDRAWIAILAYAEAGLAAMLPVLEAIARTGRPAVFFMADVSDELRDTLIVNNRQGTLRSLVVAAPVRAEYDRAQLFAVAAATGAPVIGSDRMLARTTLDMLGQADTVSVDAVSTVLSGFPLLRSA